jgi:Protein of unknown function (DUF2523)
MKYLGAFLLMLTEPLVAQVMISLGLGIVTYTGYQSVVFYVHDLIMSNIASLPADMYNIVLLSGVLEGFGIVLSAIVARAATMSFGSIQRIK